MGLSEYVDWSIYDEKWINHGRRVAEEACTHHTQEVNKESSNIQYSGWCDECGISEDSETPMMNFVYPLETIPDEDRIKQIIDKTCLTVMENEDTGEYYLALCGGGMDLSQNIAMAYYLAEKWIPFELCLTVSTQKGLNYDGVDFNIIMEAVKRSLENNIGHAEARVKIINEMLECKHEETYKTDTGFKVCSDCQEQIDTPNTERDG